jgi:hypothetical protein
LLAPWIQLTGAIDGHSGTIPAKLKDTPMPLTDYSAAARFHERVAAAALKHYQMNRYELDCMHCGEPFNSTRRDKLTCSPRCKKALQRSGRKPKATTGVGRAANRAMPVPNEVIDRYRNVSPFDVVVRGGRIEDR